MSSFTVGYVQVGGARYLVQIRRTDRTGPLLMLMLLLMLLLPLLLLLLLLLLQLLLLLLLLLLFLLLLRRHPIAAIPWRPALTLSPPSLPLPLFCSPPSSGPLGPCSPPPFPFPTP